MLIKNNNKNKSRKKEFHEKNKRSLQNEYLSKISDEIILCKTTR